MLNKILKAFLFCSMLCWFCGACGRTTSLSIKTSSPTASPAIVTSQSSKPGTCSSRDLQKQLEEIARVTNGPVGAAAIEVETGEVVALNGKQRFPMQSVYKLPIGMAVLHQVDNVVLKLEQKVNVSPADLAPRSLRSALRDRHPRGADLTVRELLTFMMVDSDSSASDVLLKTVGGPEQATKYLRELGIEDINVATSEKEMAENDQVQYQNWSTPVAMVGLLKILEEERALSSASRDLLLELMRKTWTFPGRIKGFLPVGTVVAHKTGSSGTRNGLTRTTNDVGLISLPNGHHLAVAVFVSDTKVDEKTREAVIARTARAAWDCWTKSGSSSR